MKRISVLSLSILSLVSVKADALTIIDSSTRNGSFENPTATGSQNSADFWSFGFNSDQFERLDNDGNTPDGDYTAVIGTNNGGTAHTGAYQNTGYIVSAGDSFSLSFDWGAAYNWEASDDLNWRLFTTSDNTSGGTISEIASGAVTGKNSSTLPLSNWTTENVLIEGGTIIGANIGQQLFVEFYEADQGNNQFARLDKVVLSVVPEPGNFALIAGSIALLTIMIRRRTAA